MLSASGAKSAGQARDYHQNEYRCGDYYGKDGGNIPGQWSGKGADELGLKGAIDKADSDAVMDGKSGANGVQLIKNPTTGEHRAGWDFTFSPDKSVSIMALVAGDHRIVEAVERANAKAMQALEGFAMGKTPTHEFVTTGNLVISTYRHETSRNHDPQIHCHNFISNMTRRSDGTWVALQTQEMFRAKTYCAAVGHAELAKELQQFGYEVGFTDKGSVYIVGVSRELCDQFSSRRKEILAALEKRGLSGPEASAVMAVLTRKAKNRDVDRDQLQKGWEVLSREFGGDLYALLERSDQLGGQGGVGPKAEARMQAAREAVAFAKEHLSERKATFEGRELGRAALRFGEKKVSLDEISVAIAADKDLVRVQQANWPSDRFTTQQAISLEQNNICMMREMLGNGESVLEGNSYEPTNQNVTLSGPQKEAAKHILTTKENIIAIEGLAGAGKTTMLNDVIPQARAAGWKVRGFTPDTSSADVLKKETGLETKTLAALALEKQNGSKEQQLWIVDEAGKMSSKDLADLLRRAIEVGARLVLLGDTKRHPRHGGWSTLRLSPKRRIEGYPFGRNSAPGQAA